MKNNFEHAHVVENIRFARAQKRDYYSLTLSSNSALNFVSIFGEHPIYVDIYIYVQISNNLGSYLSPVGCGSIDRGRFLLAGSSVIPACAVACWVGQSVSPVGFGVTLTCGGLG